MNATARDALALVPRLGLAAFSRRILVRAVFALLALATIALALAVLREEKQRSVRNYEQNFRKTQAEISARLRHPAGQLALLNPLRASGTATAAALHPLLLPFPALDVDDPLKAVQATESAGCQVRYPDGSSICVAVGASPYAGPVMYLVGSFQARSLVARDAEINDLAGIHRARITLTVRDQAQQWLAPLELSELSPGGAASRTRLVAYAHGAAGDVLDPAATALRDFRGALAQSGTCASPDSNADPATCPRAVWFALRLPVEAWREAATHRARPVWPPGELALAGVQLQFLGPDSATPVFDSRAAGASAPMALAELRRSLLPGEALRIRRVGPGVPEVATLRGEDEAGERLSPLLSRLVSRLPVDDLAIPSPAELTRREIVETAVGNYEIELVGTVGAIEHSLAQAATRMAWYVLAMLGAIMLAWLLIEFGLLRQVKRLAGRAAAVSYNVNAPQVDQRLGELDVADLRGRDELGILAGALADLLARVKDDVRREHIRANQDRDMWHAVGHEIMSPLQSLMVLHPAADDPSHRYVQRMQQAVKVLYGQASPGEALQAATLSPRTLDLDAFLAHVAANAHFAGIDDVHHAPLGTPVMVHADEFGLEDVLTHLLGNAARHRTPGTAVTIRLEAHDTQAIVEVHNQGPRIDEARLAHIFDYGVSDGGHGGSSRGQGLFVARTYMAKMDGTVEAINAPDGVTMRLTLRRA